MAELILSSIGSTVTQAEDGSAALAFARQTHFDVILMDLMMPVMGGLESIRLIRQHEAASGWQRTPIAVLSANSMSEHVEASLAAGADLHLAKPITTAALLQALGALLSSGGGAASVGRDDVAEASRTPLGSVA